MRKPSQARQFRRVSLTKQAAAAGLGAIEDFERMIKAGTTSRELEDRIAAMNAAAGRALAEDYVSLFDANRFNLEHAWDDES
jgi:hypothetical protein